MARAEPGALKLRVISALVLAPVPLAAIWFGRPYLTLLILAGAAVMAWEWACLCRGGRFDRGGVALVATVVVAVAAGAWAGAVPAIVLALLGTGLVFALGRRMAAGAPGWLAAGVLWVALPCISLLWLAHANAAGRSTLLWIFAIVWATDIGAYATGRRLGGPRLAPRWSPRKTWTGLLGGIACAAIVGWATAHWLLISPVLPLVLISAGLAIVEQFGDLAESVAKRRFGVKDASSLIPGHGGLLDRLDGLLAVTPAVALLTVLGGRSVLMWQ